MPHAVLLPGNSMGLNNVAFSVYIYIKTVCISFNFCSAAARLMLRLHHFLSLQQPKNSPFPRTEHRGCAQWEVPIRTKKSSRKISTICVSPLKSHYWPSLHLGDLSAAGAELIAFSVFWAEFTDKMIKYLCKIMIKFKSGLCKRENCFISKTLKDSRDYESLNNSFKIMKLLQCRTWAAFLGQ